MALQVFGYRRSLDSGQIGETQKRHPHRHQPNHPRALVAVVPLVPARDPQTTPEVHAGNPPEHDGATPRPLRVRLGQAPIRGIGLVHRLPPHESRAQDARVAHEQESVAVQSQLRAEPTQGLRRELLAEDAACRRGE